MLTCFACFVLSTAAAIEPAAAIDAVLEDFTQGAATRDTVRVGRALHDEARQYVSMPDGVQVMDKQAYLGLLAAEKIGGTPTVRERHGVEVHGEQAMARQTRDIGAMKLHDAVTLVRVDGEWQIVSVAVAVEAK
jgi:hypothetical protein